MKIEPWHIAALDRAIEMNKEWFERIHAADPTDMNVMFPEAEIKALKEIKAYLIERSAK
jgi:hypothetical protein